MEQLAEWTAWCKAIAVSAFWVWVGLLTLYGTLLTIRAIVGLGRESWRGSRTRPRPDRNGR